MVVVVICPAVDWKVPPPFPAQSLLSLPSYPSPSVGCDPGPLGRVGFRCAGELARCAGSPRRGRWRPFYQRAVPSPPCSLPTPTGASANIPCAGQNRAAKGIPTAPVGYHWVPLPARVSAPGRFVGLGRGRWSRHSRLPGRMRSIDMGSIGPMVQPHPRSAGSRSHSLRTLFSPRANSSKSSASRRSTSACPGSIVFSRWLAIK